MNEGMFLNICILLVGLWNLQAHEMQVLRSSVMILRWDLFGKVYFNTLNLHFSSLLHLFIFSSWPQTELEVAVGVS